LTLTNAITNGGEIDAGAGAEVDMKNATVTGGKLGGSGTIKSVTGNTGSTLDGVTIASGTTVTDAVGVLTLTNAITNGGEIDAGESGRAAWREATVTGGKLGGPGTIKTVTGNTGSTLDGGTIARGT